MQAIFFILIINVLFLLFFLRNTPGLIACYKSHVLYVVTWENQPLKCVTSFHWKFVESELLSKGNSSIALQFVICAQCVKGKNVVWIHRRGKFEKPELELRLSGVEVCRVQLRHCHMTHRCVTTAVKAPGWSLIALTLSHWSFVGQHFIQLYFMKEYHECFLL